VACSSHPKNCIFIENYEVMKMSRIFPQVLLICLINGVSGQDYNYLGLSVGGAFPQGSFSGKSIADSVNGFANTGFVFAFDAAWFPDDYMGIGATVTFASNYTSGQMYMDELRNEIVESFYDPEDFPADSIVQDFGVWKYLNLFIGPNFTYPLGRFNFDVRAMGGLSLAWRPSQTLDVNFPESGLVSWQSSTKAVPALGYSIGGGIRYAFKSGYVIRLVAEYANSKPTFALIDDVEWNQDSETFTVKEKEVAVPVKNIHLGIGIAYNFEL
jgi:hypothetical protein